MSLLLLLYFLQGIPIGLSTAVPMLLAGKGASFSAQALFSLAPWPYSLKLLWAPLVDALWTERWNLGPRKSWVVPVQLATGCVMIILSAHINDLFGEGGAEGGSGTPDVPALTASFFVLYLLVATQDIAVDAWALTMLRPENVGYASTANAVGQSAGVICAGSLFLALESASVADGWIRPALGLPHPLGTGLVTMQGFLATWGVVFLLVTLGVWVGKKEGWAEEVPGGAHSQLEQQEGGTVDVIGRAAVEGAGGRSVESALGAHAAHAAGAGAGVKGRQSRSPSRRVAAADAGAGAPLPGRGLRQRSRGAVGGDEAETAPLVSPTHVPSPAPAAPAAAGGGGTDGVGAGEGGAAAHGVRAAWSALTSSYSSFASLLRLPSVLTLALLLVSGKVGWQAVDRGSTLVMQGRGWPKETLASVDAVSSILQLVLQGGVLSRWSAGARPLSLYRALYPARIGGCLALLACVYLLPTRDLSSSGAGAAATGSVPPASLLAYFLLSNVYSTVSSLQFMACMAYFSRLAAGTLALAGTMVTLCNTLSNLGSSLPGPAALWLVGWATVKGCVQAGGGAGAGGAGGGWLLWPGSANGLTPCGTAELDAACAAKGEGYACVTVQDGFLLASLLGLAYSAAWWGCTGAVVAALQGAPPQAWRPSKRTAAAGAPAAPMPVE